MTFVADRPSIAKVAGRFEMLNWKRISDLPAADVIDPVTKKSVVRVVINLQGLGLESLVDEAAPRPFLALEKRLDRTRIFDDELGENK